MGSAGNTVLFDVVINVFQFWNGFEILAYKNAPFTHLKQMAPSKLKPVTSVMALTHSIFPSSAPAELSLVIHFDDLW